MRQQDGVHLRVRSAAPFQVLQLADDWEINRLKRLTEEFLLKRLTEKTCVALFKLSHSAHSQRLKQAPRRGRGAAPRPERKVRAATAFRSHPRATRA